MHLALLTGSILAQQQAGGGAAAEAPASSPLFSMLIMFGPLVLLFWLLILRPNQKREQERKKMLAALKKNDHVITVGGVKGVVSNVRLEDDEVVLKVDESTGTKLRVSLSGIARVMVPDQQQGESKRK